MDHSGDPFREVRKDLGSNAGLEEHGDMREMAGIQNSRLKLLKQWCFVRMSPAICISKNLALISCIYIYNIT